MTLQSTQMGRGGHRDDRRRRLLAEDPNANSDLTGPSLTGSAGGRGSSAGHKSENYGDAEFLETQRRLTDHVPRRLISLILLLKLGLAAIAGLMALYVWMPRLLHTPNARPAMADLGNPGSLGNWFASLLLLAASLLAVATYSVRRHKADDYRGYYHVWLWAALCWFLMATDVAASLHQDFQQVMIALTGTRITGDGSILWVVPAILLVGAIGSRLLIDMWTCRLSSAALILAAIAYLTALTAFFHGIHLQSELVQLLLFQGSLLGGHLMLAWSMALHARYVLLDAEGGLPKRTVKKKKPRKQRAEKPAAKVADAATTKSSSSKAVDDDDDEELDEAGDAWVAVDPPHGGSQPVLKRMAPSAGSTGPLSHKIASSANGSPSSSPIDESKLSKSDRKALKKKLLDERLKREQQKASHW